MVPSEYFILLIFGRELVYFLLVLMQTKLVAADAFLQLLDLLLLPLNELSIVFFQPSPFVSRLLSSTVPQSLRQLLQLAVLGLENR